MNKTTTLALYLATTLATNAGCASSLIDTFKGLGIGDIVPDVLPRLARALPDIADAVKARGIRKIAQEEACDLYGQRVRGLAEAAWAADWSKLEPMFTAPPTTPDGDESYCRSGIEALGATIFTKSEGGHGGTALYFAVGLPPGFDGRAAVLRAALMCHEYTHMIWMHRVGLPMAAIDYATVSGRVATEAIAYAIGEAIESRHGVAGATTLARRARRVERFPAKYELDKALSSECVGTIFGAVRDVLRARAGV